MEILTCDCRHGVFSFYKNDEYIGDSLERYGDYSEDEVYMFKAVLKAEDIAVEIGSNIGALTVPMARLCRKVYAFEPQPQNFNLLVRNLADNDIKNVVSLCIALSNEIKIIDVPNLNSIGHYNFGRIELDRASYERPPYHFKDKFSVSQTTLDEAVATKLIEGKIRFIKIDAEGAELKILQGAENTIAKQRPVMYIENDRKEQSAALIGWLVDHEYRCYWHHVPLFYAGNFRGEKMNMFSDTCSLMMICVPEELQAHIGRLEEVEDRRLDDQMYVREKARAMRRLDRDPNDLNSRSLVAHFANLMNEDTEAMYHLETNLAADPEHKPTLAIKSLIDLQAGRYKEGWQGYELRYYQIRPESFGWRAHDVPHWDGTPTDEKVLIWCEQGFGDSIMFGRFMREVLQRAPNAILEIQPQLYELFKYSEIMPDGQLFRLGRTMPDYAFHCSLPSVPAILHLDNEQQLIRYKYLFGENAMLKSWLKRNTPRIGICLRGGHASERAYSRDMPRDIGEALARRFGPFMTLTHEGQWESYMDTAAAIESLDLVITVDTSIAHLSGALGKPTYLMLSTDPDWRWQKYRTDTPWYPSVRIFRQQRFMDWSNVIDEVSAVMEQRQAA
jgi:FkbM family methyltransferase